MLTVDKEMMDLGNLKFGETYKFSYTITNKYPSKVIVEKLTAGCSSCTKVSMIEREIEPGGYSTIQVEFTPGSTGLQSKFVTIAYSVDSTQSTLSMKFKANVSE